MDRKIKMRSSINLERTLEKQMETDFKDKLRELFGFNVEVLVVVKPSKELVDMVNPSPITGIKVETVSKKRASPVGVFRLTDNDNDNVIYYHRLKPIQEKIGCPKGYAATLCKTGGLYQKRWKVERVTEDDPDYQASLFIKKKD